MSLRNRTLMMMSIVSFGLALVAYFALASVLMAGLNQLEAQNVTDKVQRTRIAVINQELSTLGTTVTDWAQWDDTYLYMLDRNDDYLRSNIVDATFVGLGVNFMIFAGTDGQAVYAGGYDLTQDTAIPVPTALRQYVSDHYSSAGAANLDIGTEGVLLIPDGILLVATRPILTSNGDGPVRGTLVFGRFLTDSFVDEIADTALTNASIFRVDRQLSEDLVQAQASMIEGNEAFIDPLDRNRVAGYTLVKDLDDQPAVILKLESPRLTVQQGRRILGFALAALMAVVALGTAVMWMVLEREVVSRVAALASQVRNIGQSADSDRRVSLSGGDELTELAADINQMLGSLQHARETNRIAQERQEIMARIASDYPYVAQVGNDNEMEIDWCSPGLTELVGAPSPQELLPKLWAAMKEEDQPAAIAHGDMLLQGKEDIVVFRIHNPIGQELWLRSYGHPVTEEETGQVVRVYGAIHDITNQRQAEEKHQVLNDLYTQAQKMETVGRMTAGIAHDFNNILTVINGFAELLQLEMPADNPHRELVQRIADSGGRAADLIRQLMMFSRKQVGEAQILDLNAQIGSIQPMLRRIIGEDVALETQLAPDLWPIQADPIQVEQVILNLTSNARDAMPQGGQLSIHTSNLGATNPNQPQLKPGQYVLLTVRDTGVGMSPEVQSKVFDSFFTTKKRGKGTGLGLASVYNIVEQAEGFVWLSSEEGQGTTIEIYWPRAEERTPSSAAGTGDAGDVTGSETVLVVEDDEAVRTTIQATLERCGYVVHTAHDGPSAIHVFNAMPNEFDLILTDLVMPGMGGTVVADHLRQERPDVPIMFVTGYHHEGNEEFLTACPNTSLLAKPFSVQTLASAVREILANQNNGGER